MRRFVLLLVVSTALFAGPAEELDAIRKETDASRRKRMLTKFLKTRRPGPTATDERAFETYNDAVRLAHNEKVRARFLTKRIDVRTFDAKPVPLFSFDWIRGRTWSWQQPTREDLGRRRAGELARGDALRVHFHLWLTMASRGKRGPASRDHTYPGSAPKNAANAWLEHLKKTLVQAKVRQRPAKRRLNRHYGSVWSLEVGGKRSDGRFVLHRCWFFRPKHAVLAMIQVVATDERPDPELDLMLASLRDG